MAQQIKPVRAFLPTRTSALACHGSLLASSTRHAFPSVRIKEPATGSRTFKSIMLHLGCYAEAIAATSIDQISVDLAWNGGSAGTPITDTDAVGGAAPAFKGGWVEVAVLDVTDEFNAHFGSGAYADLVVGAKFVLSTAGNVLGLCGYIVGTVEVDDSAARVSKVVCLPLDGPTAKLSTSLTELGTNQIPDLEAIFGDLANLAIGPVTLTSRFNADHADTATPNLLSYGIDGGAAIDRSTIPANTFEVGIFDVLDLTGIDTSVAHALKAKQALNVAGTGIQSIDLRLWVEIEYDAPAPGTGTSWVTREIPFVLQAGDVNPNASYHYVDVEFLVRELGPGVAANPTLKQSGLCLAWTAAGFSPGLDILAGSQSSQRQYPGVGAHAQEGLHCASHRVDSGAQYGAGLTLTRGTVLQRIRVDAAEAVNRPCGITGSLILNYLCRTPAEGDLAATRSVRYGQHPTRLTDVLASSFELPTTYARTPSLPSGWVMCSSPAYLVGYVLALFGGGSSFSLPVALSIETKAGERPDTAWLELEPILVGSSNLWGGYVFGHFFVVLTRALRWDGDPDTTRLDLEVARKLRPSVKANRRFWVELLLDISTQVATVGGQVKNLSSPGGITLDVRRADTTKELVGTCITDGAGAYSAPVPDPAVDYILDGVDGSGNRGRSKAVTPS